MPRHYLLTMVNAITTPADHGTRRARQCHADDDHERALQGTYAAIFSRLYSLLTTPAGFRQLLAEAHRDAQQRRSSSRPRRLFFGLAGISRVAPSSRCWVAFHADGQRIADMTAKAVTAPLFDAAGYGGAPRINFRARSFRMPSQALEVAMVAARHFIADAFHIDDLH